MLVKGSGRVVRSIAWRIRVRALRASESNDLEAVEERPVFEQLVSQR